MLINPYVHAAAGGVDPHFAHVRALLHFDGTNGSTTITDQIAGHSWAAANGAVLSTAQKLFGTASGLISDSNDFFGDQDTDFDLGTGDFTIEVSVYPTTVATKNILQVIGTSGATSASIYCLATGELIYYMNADRITSAAGVVVANTWNRIAYSRVSGTGRLFAGGTLIGSWSDSTDYTKSSGGNELYVSGSAAPLEGYYDEFRLTAYGRYSASYTPDAAAFPDS